MSVTGLETDLPPHAEVDDCRLRPRRSLESSLEKAALIRSEGGTGSRRHQAQGDRLVSPVEKGAHWCTLFKWLDEHVQKQPQARTACVTSLRALPITDEHGCRPTQVDGEGGLEAAPSAPKVAT